MANYTWTAKDRTGKAVVREVRAATVQEAKALLIAEGCSDLKLMEDEILTATAESFSKEARFLGAELKVTAEERIKHFNKPAPTIFRTVLESLKQEQGLYLVLIPILAFAIYKRNVWVAVVPIVLIGAWLAFRIWMGLPGILYGKLHKAKDWHRWDEALELVRKLEVLSRNHSIKIPEPELARSRAEALTGLGRLPEALALFEMQENRPGMPSWLYKAHLGSLLSLAKQYEKAQYYSLAAIEETPSPALYLDLANRYLRFLKKPAEARVALAEVEKGTVPEFARAFHHRVRGVLAYVEGDFSAANQELKTSIQMMEETHHLPGREGNIAVAKAYLCCVLAHLGDLPGAKKYFAEAEEYLIATDETELIAECKGAMKG
jgi:tetratricopeptide (TPR) repeat protein